jgi:hypothetical protein
MTPVPHFHIHDMVSPRIAFTKLRRGSGHVTFWVTGRAKHVQSESSVVSMYKVNEALNEAQDEALARSYSKCSNICSDGALVALSGRERGIGARTPIPTLRAWALIYLLYICARYGNLGTDYRTVVGNHRTVRLPPNSKLCQSLGDW